MELLSGAMIRERLSRHDDQRLWIEPLLETSQIGEVTIDLRIGYDFLVPVLTRRPFIGLDPGHVQFRDVASYYQSTRREMGDRFILYPGQVVLTTTLEYIALPGDVYADILPRSSYARLGMHFGTMIQPGYRGCFPLELANANNNAIELIVGSRVVQARLFAADTPTVYNRPLEARKYFGTTRPVVSRAASDTDIQKLLTIASARS